jgi:hypothetical protein
VWPPSPASTADSDPAPRGRAALQRSLQPGHLPAVQPAYRPASAFGGRRGFTASAPAPPPLIRRLGAHPQPVRDLHRAGILLKKVRACCRTRSRLARAAAVRPPPSGYLIPPGVDLPPGPITQARRT